LGYVRHTMLCGDMFWGSILCRRFAVGKDGCRRIHGDKWLQCRGLWFGSGYRGTWAHGRRHGLLSSARGCFHFTRERGFH